MEGKIEKLQEPPEEAPEPSPIITPEMIQTTLKTLETKRMIHYAEGGAYVPTEKGWKLLMGVKPTKEEIIAYGHPDIKATDTACFKITKSATVKTDVKGIVAVKANKGCADLSNEVKHALKEAKKVEITLEAGEEKDEVTAYGSPALKLSHSDDIVVRKDDFVDSRTLAILADKAANELKQELVEKLRTPNIKVKITLEIK